MELEPEEQKSVDEMTTEELRAALLDDLYAAAFSGMPAVLSEEDDIRNADEEKLRRMASYYGY